jgi:hypothetical protein
MYIYIYIYIYSSASTCYKVRQISSRFILNVKLHKEELQDLYCLPSMIRIIKPRKMSGAGHVARIGDKRNVCIIFEVFTALTVKNDIF